MIGEGHGAVRLVDVSGNTMQLDTSGRITIAGGSITASISGDTVIAKISGETVIAKISGETIASSISGNTIATWRASGMNQVYLANQSGSLAIATGIANSDNVANNNLYLFQMGVGLGFNEASGGFSRIRVTQSGGGLSGVGLKLIVAFSGEVATVSGNAVTISGNVVTNSGVAVNMAAAVVTAPAWLSITGASGGTTLASQACTMVRLMNLSGNGTMLVGGTGTAAPVSGTKGIMLWPGSLSVQGTEMDFPVNNANLLAVVAHTSGNTLAYMTFG